MRSFLNWLFFLALFLIFLLPPTDPDLGWHLRCGEQIWQEHSLCSQNEFSVLLENYSWPNPHWLYQATIFPIYKFAGLWGLTILGAAVLSLAFAAFYLSVKNYSWEKTLAVFLVVLSGWGVFSFGIRSQLTGFLFFNLLLLIFSRVEQKPKLALLFPPIMLVWANAHASVVLGLVLLAFFGAREAGILIFRSRGQIRRFLLPALVLILSFAATLLNPFGFRIYQEAWRHFAGSIDLSQLIAEWVPPVPSVWWLVLYSGLGVSLYLLIAGAENIASAFLVAAFTFLALKARRHVLFHFTLISYLVLISPTTRDLLARWLKRERLREILAIATSSILLLAGLALRLPETYVTNRSWQSFCQSSSLNFPCQAVDFLKKQEEKGNIFNRYEWGGFLIWQLPKYKIFVDGRMPAWPTPSGKSPYTIYLETLQTQPGWEKILDAYRIDWILISPGTFMDLRLAPDPEKFGWQEAYRDEISVVYKRVPEAN